MPEDRIRALTGILKGRPSLIDALMKSRKEERGREEEKAARYLGNHHPEKDKK